MKVIVAGSRSIKSYSIVSTAIMSAPFKIDEIVSGTAYGVDKLGEAYALRHKIKVSQFPADWNKYGKSAGYKRNEQMADYADALIAVWDGVSKGTNHMIEIAKRKNLKIFIYTIKSEEQYEKIN